MEFDGWPRKTIEHFFYTTPSFVHHFKAIGEAKLELQSGNAQVGSKLVTFLSCGTLKFDGWSWKSIGHLFYTTLSCVHHFTGMGEFKLELQSGNPKFRSKSAIFFSRVTLKFEGCPLKPEGHLPYPSSSFVHNFVPIGESKLELQSGNAQFESKSMIFFSRVTLEFHGWPWKTIEHLFFTILSFVHHFKAMSEFNIELQSGNAQFGSKSAIFCPVRPWNLADDLENNRAPHLCCSKLCASFHSHWWI